MDLGAFEKDNRINCKIQGLIPERTKTEPCCLGIDEAGRGPVLGPMVYGTAFCPLSIKDDIKELGLADSKTLTEQKRDEILDKIIDAKDRIGWIVDVLSPNYISTCMLRRFKYNLNTLSHDTATGLIQSALDQGANIREVYVDTVGDPGKYQAKLKDIFPDLDITVAKKADATYPIVGAASICAKVCRDRAVQGWQFLEGLCLGEQYNYGSGYPGDDKTKKFLMDTFDSVFGFPNFVRFSWSTASTIMEDKGVPVYWSDDEDEDEGKPPKGVPAITSFFQGKENSGTATHSKRHRYFSDRCLQQVINF